MLPLSLLQVQDRPSIGQIMPIAHAERAWTADVAHRRDIFLDIDDATNREIRAAMEFVRANGLNLETVEQEDFRVPRFARAVPELRRRLDSGCGIVVLRGIDLDPYDDGETGVVTWGLGNYIGRPIRQALARDRRLFSVTDRGSGYGDPTRIGATTAESRPHTDNGCLEPRPPCYIGLLCVHQAASGGTSSVLSAVTVHNTFLRDRPDLIGLLYEPFHFKPPQLHAWPKGPATIVKPIFERVDGELRIHYARVMVEPGMAMAGTPLTARQREALDLLDDILARDDLAFAHALQRGEFLVINNLTTVHGRGAYADAPQANGRRLLQRIWLWRRHVGPGLDPVALDALEFPAAHQPTG